MHGLLVFVTPISWAVTRRSYIRFLHDVLQFKVSCWVWLYQLQELKTSPLKHQILIKCSRFGRSVTSAENMQPVYHRGTHGELKQRVLFHYAKLCFLASSLLWSGNHSPSAIIEHQRRLLAELKRHYEIEDFSFGNFSSSFLTSRLRHVSVTKSTYRLRS